MRLFFLLASLVFLPAASAQSPPPQAALVIEQLTTFAQRMHDKQEDAILASYTTDAVFIDPSGQHFTTPAQRRALYDRVFATLDSELHFDPPAITLHGHSYHLSGTFTEPSAPAPPA